MYSLPMSVEIHPTAIVDEGALIGEGTRIWHWTHVCSRVTIGRDCSIGQSCYVGNDVEVGHRVRVQNNVSIYDQVQLEDDVFCGPSMVFTNVINPRSQFPRKNEYKKTLVRRGASLGANSTLVCGIEVGRYAFVAAGAVVTKNVLDFSLVMGVPAKHVGWMSRFGERIPLPLSGEGDYRCDITGDEYVLNGNHLVLVREGERKEYV